MAREFNNNPDGRAGKGGKSLASFKNKTLRSPIEPTKIYNGPLKIAEEISKYFYPTRGSEEKRMSLINQLIEALGKNQGESEYHYAPEVVNLLPGWAIYEMVNEMQHRTAYTRATLDVSFEMLKRVVREFYDERLLKDSFRLYAEISEVLTHTSIKYLETVVNHMSELSRITHDLYTHDLIFVFLSEFEEKVRGSQDLLNRVKELKMISLAYPYCKEPNKKDISTLVEITTEGEEWRAAFSALLHITFTHFPSDFKDVMEEVFMKAPWVRWGTLSFMSVSYLSSIPPERIKLIAGI